MKGSTPLRGTSKKDVQTSRGKSSTNITRNLNVTDIKLVQKAYHNGCYGLYSLNSSLVLQSDGIIRVRSESLHRHDYIVIHRINVIEMKKIQIGNDLVTHKVSSDSS